MTNLHGTFCDRCHLIIAPQAPKIRDEDGDFHMPACYAAKNVKKRIALQSQQTSELIKRLNGRRM